MTFRKIVIALALTIGWGLACGQEDPPHAVRVDAEEPAETGRVFETKVFHDQRRSKYGDQVDLAAARALKQKEFAVLEDMSGKYRVEKTREEDGLWKLRSFYRTVSTPKIENDQTWQILIEVLDEWQRQYPESITAPVARAEAWIEYAWYARGGGWANTVSADGWRKMKERIAGAHTILKTAESLPEQCPEYYAALQKVALAQGWPRARYDEVFRKAIQREPEYYRVYMEYAWYLLPRWHGEDIHDWEEMADSVTAEIGGKLGDEIYARVVWSIYPAESNIFKDRIVSWDKMKRGFEVMMERWPDSKWNLSAFCFYSCISHDKKGAHKLFQELDGFYLGPIWYDREYYEKCRTWAAGGKVDFTEK